MKSFQYTFIFCFVLLCDLSVAAEVRTWTSGRHSVEAELVEVSADGKLLTLRRSDNGKEITLALDKVSEKDRSYVEEQKKQLNVAGDGSSRSASKGISVGPATGKGQRRALLIGVNDYEDLTCLKYCEEDALALCGALLKLGFHSSDIKLLTTAPGTKNHPTRLNIEEHLDVLFEGLSENDMVLISLSGHGGQFAYRSGGHTKEESFFCPKDARSDKPDLTMVSIQKIYDRLDKCPAKFKLLLVDACRDEQLLPPGSRSAGLSARQAIDGFSKSVSDMTMPKGTVAFTSCAAKEKSYESPKLKQGVFMYHVVQGSLGEADADNDGIVTVFELRNYVIQQTTSFVFREFDRKKQNPFFHSHIETADFELFDVSSLQTGPKPTLPHVPNTPLPELDGTAGQLLRTFGKGDYNVWRAAYSPDGSMIASCGPDKSAKIWNVGTGEQIAAIGHVDTVSDVCFSPSSELLLSASIDGCVKVSKVHNGETICNTSWQKSLGDGYIRSGVFLSDEKHVAIATGTKNSWDNVDARTRMENAIHLINVSSTKLARSYFGHTRSVNCVAISPDGKKFLSGSYDRIVGLWDVQTGKSLKTLGGHSKAIYQVAFSPDGNLALSVSPESCNYNNTGDNTARIWNLETGAEIRMFTLEEGKLSCAALSPSGKTIALCVNGGNNRQNLSRIKFCDLSTGKERGSFDCLLKNVWSIAFSPDGQALVVGAENERDVNSKPKLQIFSTGLKE